MITLLYSGFVNYPMETMEVLITSNDMNNFLDWTALLLSSKFFNVYQAKVKIYINPILDYYCWNSFNNTK